MATARIEPLATLDLSRLNVRSRQVFGRWFILLSALKMDIIWGLLQLSQHSQSFCYNCEIA